MFTVEWNKEVWEQHYPWSKGGDEWSGAWGGVAMQWHRTILPRIQAYLPAKTVLEIAPGFGRWTAWLKDQCQKLIVVDLTEKCIEGCRRRFAESSHIECHVNDGRTLPMVADGTVDFAFSFDSLVHVNREVVASYLCELARTLSRDGVAFLHHSNLGEYGRYYRMTRRLPFGGMLERWGVIERNKHFRAPDVSASLVQELAESCGLQCISQELVNWGSRRLIDCFTLLTRRGSRHARANRVLRNGRFRDEVRGAAALATLYPERT